MISRVYFPERGRRIRMAARIGLPGTAGSDAHRVDEVGRCVMDFERSIENERELVEELRAGRFSVPTRSLR